MEFVQHVGENVMHHKTEIQNKERTQRTTEPRPQKRDSGPQKHQNNDGKSTRSRNTEYASKTVGRKQNKGDAPDGDRHQHK
eukprot:8944533-Prorocentrum_lima.AAC.1